MNTIRRPLSETEAFLSSVLVFQAQLDTAIRTCPDNASVEALVELVRLHSGMSTMRCALEAMLAAYAGLN